MIFEVATYFLPTVAPIGILGFFEHLEGQKEKKKKQHRLIWALFELPRCLRRLRRVEVCRLVFFRAQESAVPPPF